MSKVPADLKYTPTHEWLRIDGDIATLGITDYAQSELGDIVYVDLPTPGRVLAAGDSFCSVESVKTVSEVYAPIAGTVTAVNPALASQSELLNSDPYEGGYLIKMQIADSTAVNALLNADSYKALLG